MKTVTFISVIFFFAALAFGDVINVPSDQATIQAGINAAANGDTVLVADSTYYENINFNGKAITVASLFLLDQDTSHISKTIIDGSRHSNPDSGSVVFFMSGEDTTSVLCGFTITGGTGTEWPDDPAGFTTALRTGGGIHIQFSGVIICHNIIKDNTVENEEDAFGAGISAGYLNSDKWVVIKDNKIFNNHLISNRWAKGCGIAAGFNNIKILDNEIHHNTIIGNSADHLTSAAGIWYSDFADSSHISIIDGNYIYKNSVTSISNFHISGSGLYVSNGGGYTLINNNTIKENESLANNIIFGNGIMLQNCDSVDVFNNTIILNTFSGGKECRGGGICIYECSPVMINNIIADNVATHGGGIYSGKYSKTYPKIINNTIANNSASVMGGGIYFHDSYPEMMNSILWNNSAPSGPQIFQRLGSVDITYSNVQGGFSGSGNINSDPIFSDTLFHLTAGSSPCIDTGNPDQQFNDPEDPANLGFALWPAMGSLLNDMGAYGGITDSLYDFVTNIDQKPKVGSSIASNFELFQNYPNPFNPVTSIEYQLPQISQVDLSIFNILGQKVATLVSEKQLAGSYKVEWDAGGFASGIYFYRLETDKGFVQSRKLILLK